MIWLEAVAAGLVGLALVALVVGPLLARDATAPVAEPEEPEDLEETPKGIALAALKEIEFDRATGKLSDEDYAFLKQKYTAAALEALRAEEGRAAGVAVAGPDVDGIIEARAVMLRAEGRTGGPVCPTCGPRPEADAVFCSACGANLEPQACARCGSALAAGSRFCEMCGTRVAA